jgi:ketosteroid isomerase-like protein
MERARVAAWLDAYRLAWQSYDRQAIGDLFSEDASYYYHPYDEPVRGRESIVASWLEQPDASGTYTGQYESIAVDSDVAVASGRSRYFEADGSTIRVEFDNLFVMRFDADGRCSEFREWYMQRPQGA